MSKCLTRLSFHLLIDVDGLTIHCSIHSGVSANLEQVILELKKKVKDGSLHVVYTSLHLGAAPLLPLSFPFPTPRQL